MSMATGGYANRRDNDQDELDAVETSTAVKVGKEAKRELTEHRPGQREKVD
jgi:hypothetical protein